METMYWKSKKELELLGSKNAVIMKLMGVLDRGSWNYWSIYIIKDIFLELARDRMILSQKLLDWRKEQIRREKDIDLELAGCDDFQKRTKKEIEQAVDDYTQDILELLGLVENDPNLEETLSLFEKLVEGRPLTPLTGEDDEWETIPMLTIEGDEVVGLQKNKRWEGVMRHRGVATDYNAILFHSASRGLSYYSKESKKVITFPYLPVTEVVEV